MTRSGLQQDVINLYRQGVRNAMSKTPEARQSFLLHLRYNFRNPPLRQRDYTAIEHQLRKMSRTLEMLSESSTQRISISPEWKDWWAEEVYKAKTKPRPKSTIPESSNVQEQGDKEDKTQVLKKDEDGRDRDQWGGKLPGHGGT
ncbi:uncharacterized protein I206_107025 [Kwoniella pini CBS 10737]|uniref:Succinate dehydrogenase assembly factor 1, mitochondrial n=1 Tax=Kwoniella pini CBS 10737 TaxID=1296096 RepID=A0A1B9HZE6_9TREE|nr:uncharacterized protein I206_05432 [Kwoniella pini CBS 10737]OCF48652.1 hypothetical protein I206_05432 [Kwoniella pini CBS 10737]